MIHVTRFNVDSLEMVVDALTKNLDSMSLRLRQYPIECEFMGYRYVFIVRKDIETLIQHIQQRISEYRAPNLC